MIPTEREVAAQFGAGFAEHGIQTIWLRVTNDSDADLWLLPVAIDADYYSAGEAALLAGAKLPAERAAALEVELRDKGGDSCCQRRATDPRLHTLLCRASPGDSAPALRDVRALLSRRTV